MGSYNSLSLLNYNIEWNKNFLIGCGFLFREEDRKIKQAEGGDEYPIYSKKLQDVKEILDLNGYTLNNIEPEILRITNNKLALNQFIAILSITDFNLEINITDLTWTDCELTKFIHKTPQAFKLFKEAINDDFFNFQELNPYYVIRCLAETDNYAEKELIWNYYDLVLGGWIEEKDLCVGESSSRFLILTEGKTDTNILKFSIEKLRPDISDFFYFVDMDNHPFGGIKDIVKFCKGLKNIQHFGDTLVILDNDITGNEAKKKIDEINLPPNFKVLTLPEHKEFLRFPTKGTDGDTLMNINGSAVSIESFLDFNSLKQNVFTRWTQWNEKAKKYQGSFDSNIKGKLLSKFLESYKRK